MDQELKGHIDGITKHLNKVVGMQDKAFAKLPPEVYEKVKDNHAQINEIMREFRKGNYDALDKILKNANTNR